MKTSYSGLWDYARLLGLSRKIAPKNRITLGEGHPPLVWSRRIGPSLGLENLAFLDFTGEPSFSYKSMFAACAVSHMLEAEQTQALLTSSGNTGSAVAAYCARAGIKCTIVVADGTPRGKLLKMLACGAKIIEVRNFGRDPAVDEQVFSTLQRLSAQDAKTALLVSSYKFCPQGMLGAEAVAFRLAQDPDLKDQLDHLFCPAGGGGLFVAVGRGFNHSHFHLKPALHIAQPTGCDTMATCLREGRDGGDRVARSTTKVSGLSVSVLLDAPEAIQLARASGGTGFACTDEEIWAAQMRLAREEGILAEPAGAASLAAAIKAAQEGVIKSEQVVVCIVSGAAFNDAHAFEAMAANGTMTQGLDIGSLEAVIAN